MESLKQIKEADFMSIAESLRNKGMLEGIEKGRIEGREEGIE